MKNIILFSISIFLLLISCRKDVEVFFPGLMPLGEASAKKNGVKWEASAVASYHSDTKTFISFGMATINENDFNREAINFNEIPAKIGKYKMSRGIADLEDDLVGASYFRLEPNIDF